MIFDQRVMGSIAAEVLEAFNAVPRRGAETGGLLLGREIDNVIHVEDFEPVLCEHRFGPAFLLSEDDLRGLEESIEWFRGSGCAGLDVLGFYRSQTREGDGLEDRDRQLVERFFPNSVALFLLLRPNRLQSISAQVHLAARGVEHPTAAPAPFPFGEPPETTPEPEPLDLEPYFPESLPQPVEARAEILAPAPAEALQEVATPAAVAIETAPEPKAQPPSRIAPGFTLLPPPSHIPRLEEEQPAGERKWIWPAAIAALTIIGAVLGYRSVPTPPSAVPSPASVSAIPASAISPTSPAPAPAVPVLRASYSPTAVEPEIRAALNRWEVALRSGNTNDIVNCYAPRLERYFKDRNASTSDVRKTVTQSLNRYGRPVVLRVSELKIDPVSDRRAIATFRKHWQTGGPRIFAGEEQEQLAFVKIENSWRIASEREIRVYWRQRPR